MAKKITVLLIEDDPDQISLYQTKFELEGFDVLSTRKGTEGIELAKTKNPDIILLDLVLIAEDGLDVLDKLKNDTGTQHIPVVILTNLVKKEVKEKAKSFGAADFIIKTDTVPKDVVLKIKEVLKQ